MERYSGRRRRIAIAFYVLSIIAFLVSLERLVFDVFGQMWGTMLLNGMSTISLLGGLLSVCAAEKVAISLYAGWCVLSIGLNIIIVFIYHDVGLLAQKEHVLGLVVGNDNWWRTHGIRCSSPEETAGSGGGSGMGRSLSGDTCLLSYTTIETIHAAIFMLLTVITFVLSLALLCSREKKQKPIIVDDDNDFSYLSIGPWYENEHPQPRRYHERRTSATSSTHILV